MSRPHPSWPAIETHGLLSTSALLDLYGVNGEPRKRIERMHRPKGIPIAADGLAGAMIRDQIPMSDSGLRRALPARLEPADWYSLLNLKVFFWLTENRLHRLTGAGAYRDSEHDVLEVDSRSLIDTYRDKIWLCPINSGCTKPMPWPRDEYTFLRIDDYPYSHWRKRRPRGERVVELAIDYSVPDIAAYVRRVVAKRRDQIISVIL